MRNNKYDIIYNNLNPDLLNKNYLLKNYFLKLKKPDNFLPGFHYSNLKRIIYFSSSGAFPLFESTFITFCGIGAS